MIRALPWDTEFFGFPIGTVEGGAEPHELQGFECVYWLADVGDERPLGLGFKKVDERLTLEFNHQQPFEPGASATGVLISPVADAPGSQGRCKFIPPALISTVRSSHTDSRFFQDSRFPRERCEDLYQRWLERDFLTAPCWTIERVGEAAGYITLTVNEGSTSIGLLGVAEQYRGHGLAKSLISRAIQHSYELGLPCRVVTQGRNVAALKAYSSMGFAEVQRQVWWHWWRTND